MAQRKFSREDEAFIQGMLAALAVVAEHDAETIFEGAENLVWVARKHSDMKLSGLSRYGYSSYRQRVTGGRIEE